VRNPALFAIADAEPAVLGAGRRRTSAALDRASPGQGHLVVPRHPSCWGAGRLLVVPQQLGQVVEGISAAEEARLDQAHVEVAHVGPATGLVEE
jgi:hypothetical protein